MHTILQAVTHWTTTNIAAMGYYGIIIMMGIESACIPLPSEIIMPFGGYLVYSDPSKFGPYGIFWMGVAGALGCVWGSIAAYYAGMYGGRPFVMRYGRFILVREQDLDKADAFFKRYGDAAIFISRLLPVVRTFISFPAGISKMPFWRFIVYTFLGSLPWCMGLAWVGKILGKEWDTKLKGYFHGADVIIGVVILVMIALSIYHHIKSDRQYRAKKNAQG